MHLSKTPYLSGVAVHPVLSIHPIVPIRPVLGRLTTFTSLLHCTRQPLECDLRVAPTNACIRDTDSVLQTSFALRRDLLGAFTR